MKIRLGQGGIALIQILLIIGVLSVLVLYFSQTSRQQVSLAQLATDRAQAQVNIHHAKNNLLMALLTTERHKVDGEQTSQNLAARWNFYHQTFSVDNNVSARLQDQAGLMSVHFIEPNLLVSILTNNQISMAAAANVVRNLLDWFDADTLTREFGSETAVSGIENRNGPISVLDELQFVPGVTDTVYLLLKKSLSTHFIDALNPLNAPESVLKGLVNASELQQIIALRNSGQLEQQQFVQLTGINESDTIRFFPSNIVDMTLVSQVGDVNLQKQWVLEVNPYASVSSPVNVIETKH